MKAEDGSVITLAYDLSTESGEIIESSDISGPITHVVGSSAMIPGLDARLKGLEKGDERQFVFEPKEAFGAIEDAPVKGVPRAEFPAQGEVKAGLKFEAGMPGGQTVTLEVADVKEDEVMVRMIHPLAGQKIAMNVQVLALREGTAAEKESGRVVTAPPPPPKA